MRVRYKSLILAPACTKATYVFRQLYSIARAFSLPGSVLSLGFSNQRKTPVALCMQGQKPRQKTRPDFGLILVMIFLSLLFRYTGNRRVFICPNWGNYAQDGAWLYRTKSLWERPLRSAFSLFFRNFFFNILIMRPQATAQV